MPKLRWKRSLQGPWVVGSSQDAPIPKEKSKGRKVCVQCEPPGAACRSLAPQQGWRLGSRALQGSGQSALCFPRLGKCTGSCSSLKALFWLGTGGVFSLSSSGIQILPGEIRIWGEEMPALRLWMSRVWEHTGALSRLAERFPASGNFTCTLE